MLPLRKSIKEKHLIYLDEVDFEKEIVYSTFHKWHNGLKNGSLPKKRTRTYSFRPVYFIRWVIKKLFDSEDFEKYQPYYDSLKWVLNEDCEVLDNLIDKWVGDI